MELLLRLPPAAIHQLSNPLTLVVASASNSTLSLAGARPSSGCFTRLPAHARIPLSARASSSSSSNPTVETARPSGLSATPCTKWAVVMEKPPSGRSSKPEVIDYYVETLARVLGRQDHHHHHHLCASFLEIIHICMPFLVLFICGINSEREAQMCIYDASWQTHFGFCCDIDEEVSHQLARLPGVLSVVPDQDPESKNKDHSYSNFSLGYLPIFDGRVSKFSPSRGNSEYWLVRMEKPGVEVVTKAQMVDYYAQTLTKVMGNEKDAQVSIYHISWEMNYGFCCQIDKECAQELADVPGVLSVQPDVNFESNNKDYKGDGKLSGSENLAVSSEINQRAEIKTRRLFVTGLSFYTSEKTLRAAFESFGELVEVKIIMDKISKRSKGYAFIEYTTEEAAGAALKEMNGKIINGWMIVVDIAKTNPPRYSRGRPQPSTSSASS